MATDNKTYYVWFIASKDEFAEQLISKMVRRGFTVGPLGRSLITKHEDNPACVVTISVFRAPKNEAERTEYTAGGIYDEVTNVMKLLKGKFWAVVVTQSGECTWNYGNLSLAAEQKLLDADAKKVN